MQPRLIDVKGRLDLHGLSHNIVWTRLNQTASAGSKLITLSESVDWSINDDIVITTTDRSISHTERHSIDAVISSTVIRTKNPLAYDHRVIRQVLTNGEVIHVAAAVGLLTRSVRIINQNPSPSLVGVQILVNLYAPPSNKGFARLSHVQFIGFGRFDDTSYTDQKAGIYLNTLNTYDSSRPTFIKSCSFDGGFNAA